MANEFVTLRPGPKGGLTVPVAAYNLIFALVNRDLVLTQHGESLRVQGPNGTKPDLTPEETALIKRWKFHLIALINYVPPEEPFL